MKPEWIKKILRNCNFHEKNGEVSIAVANERLCLQFDCEYGNEQNRCEVAFPKDSHNIQYKVTGSFLIPSWVDLDPGMAVILQWHCSDQSTRIFTIRADNDYLSINNRLDSVETVLDSVPYSKDKWININANYIWANGDGNSIFDITLNNENFCIDGPVMRDMYMKAGIYRTRHQQLKYSHVQLYWSELQKDALPVSLSIIVLQPASAALQPRRLISQ